MHSVDFWKDTGIIITQWNALIHVKSGVASLIQRLFEAFKVFPGPPYCVTVCLNEFRGMIAPKLACNSVCVSRFEQDIHK